VTNIFLTGSFLNRFATIPKVGNDMEKATLIKHKKVVMICEESGLVIAKYNALFTQLEVKPID
jgi:hypothetical protein